MAEKRLPSSTGGIMQYFDEYKSHLSLTPKHVIIATGVLVVLVILLNFINPFGL
ncbi:MAG: preprotein translocase subunit Sec61beta [Candidatus Nanoarchaeia archaeon]|nr:preprotein translocase subunit Sec61beta [Candidatus Nanoarchaeia archaeon]MDD5499493.1 preprotein translocase subunit Sec61beta [Candidatus Nanoarchaeia archaeon]